MDVRIVELNIINQKKYLLVSPCKKKLASIKKVIENYSEYESSDKKLSWEEFEMLKELEIKGLSDGLDYIIKTSFITLNIDETYEINGGIY
jgi:hypothetical protein